MGLNKSRPIYEKLRIDPLGRAHLLVTDQPALPEAAIEADLALSNIEIWDGKSFPATTDLLAQLRQRLAREAVGLRLYAAGTEAFLWDVHNIAREAGLGKDEIFLSHSGSFQRRVYCTHCKHHNEDVTTNIVTCRNCGANLFVRDHFSRRLAAFMGVMVDAEVPGEIPEIETLYP